MSLTRNSVQWHLALDEFVLARIDRPFEWGTNDCCTFAADWFLAVHGHDVIADMRRYSDARTAAAMLAAEGGLRVAVERRIGPGMAGSMAQRGDVAIVLHGDRRKSMGVCVGNAFVAPGDKSMVWVPLTDAEAAWRV